jgi:hypothetical protein
MPFVLKLLTPEALASAIIGKGGTVIAELRQRTQSKIGLTEHNILFPGTDCRILTAQANSMEHLRDLSKDIISKLNDLVQTAPAENLGQPGELKLKILVPKAAVGGIIGKAGASVKQLREQSGAKISISDPVGTGVTAEQVVAISGTQKALEQVLTEINKQVQALNEEAWFQSWATNNGGYGGYQGMSSGGGKGSRNGYGGGMGMNPGVDLMLQVASGLPPYVMEDSRGFALSCVVPNRLVGGIIGRGGSGTKEVQNLTGAKIGIREIPGDPDNRSLNIAGPLANTCAAYMLMMKRYLDSESAAAQQEG